MARLRVEVVYALRDRQESVRLELVEGARVADALVASGLFKQSGLDPDAVKLGIFGKEVDADTVLADGDRVELYRPLALDPKDARRIRARRDRRK